MVLLAPIAKRLALTVAQALTPIPVEISSSDVREYVAPRLLEPDVSIAALDGASNLGCLLWAFVLYQGIFTTAGRPADWVLPALAKVFSLDDSDWLLDYKAGYAFTVPTAVELSRIAIFVVLGYYSNLLTILLFEGDAYWGWATAGALSIPVGLLALARGTEPKYTRAIADLEKQAATDFCEWALQRLSIVPETITASGQRIITKTQEQAVMRQFRRSQAAYRDETGPLTDKILRRVIRDQLRRKPDREGAFRNIAMSDLTRDAKAALKANLKTAALAQSAAEAEAKAKAEADAEINAEVVEGSDFVRRR